MAKDAIRGRDETQIWSEVPDLRDKLLRLMRLQNVLSPDALKTVTEASARGEGSVTEVMLAQEIVDEQRLIEFLEQTSGYPAVDPREHAPADDALRDFPLDLALAFRGLPLKRRGERLFVVLENPNDLEAKQRLQETLKTDLEPLIFHSVGIFEAIRRAYPEADEAELERIRREQGHMRIAAPREVEVTREETALGLLNTPLSEVLLSPISDVWNRPWFTKKRVVTRKIKIPEGVGQDVFQPYTSSSDSATAVTEALLMQALQFGATDIHIEPMPDAIRIRLRRDQVLWTMNYLALEMHSAVVNRIKVLSRLDLADRRSVQESSFRFGGPNSEIHFRVSIIPASRGETVELRVIDGRQGKMELDHLGMLPGDLERFERNLYYPSGLILITGPTASGKTTTLYSALKRLNVEGRKIISAEDPIEYDLYGVTQVEVNPKINMTYASALKAFLRQDPDVMMLGEIRDTEVANVAIGAALTGHLVLAALHTNDASSAPSRLLHTLGCDPMLVSDALLMIVGQRLVRLLCPRCRTTKPVTPELLAAFGGHLDGIDADPQPIGCDACHNTGYTGVRAVFEVMDTSARIKQLVFEGASTAQIMQASCEQGMVPMHRNALSLVKEGATSLSEVKRVMMYKTLF